LKPTEAEPLAKRVRPAIVAEGWQSNGEPPGVRDVCWAIADFIRPATAGGLIHPPGDFPFHREPLVLTQAGRPALIARFATGHLRPGPGRVLIAAPRMIRAR